MDNSFDKEKIIECMFDPITSEILSELESGEKEITYLAEKSEISNSEVTERLSYLLKYEFVKEQTKNDKIIYSVDAQKLSKIMEHDENFDSAIDGLTKLDSYLN